MNQVFSKNMQYLLVAIRINVLGLSQAHLCSELGVSSSTIHYLEKGKSLPSIKQLSTYAKLMKCSVHELVEAVETNKGKYAYLIQQGKQLLNK